MIDGRVRYAPLPHA